MQRNASYLEELEPKKRRSNFDITPAEMGKNLHQVLDQLNKASDMIPVFIPATEPVFILRLEKALQRNFDYIRRFVVF
jgi:anaerobic glycerol-3-phosphate dehydrogenase